jgi:putative sterol carrier protein
MGGTALLTAAEKNHDGGPMPTTAEVMQSLPDRFQAKMAGNMQTTIQFELTGEDGGQWVMTIAGGRCTVRPGQTEQADATIITEAAEFVGIQTGQIPAREAFWSGRVKVEGDLEAVIRLPPVMGW